jgi:predicted DNA-binding antitoxin AbrB/MazE fold protein
MTCEREGGFTERVGSVAQSCGIRRTADFKIERRTRPCAAGSTDTSVSATIGVGGIAMREQIEVVYENGVLRPLGTLSGQFQEHQRLTVTVEAADESARRLDDADPTASLEAVRRALGKAPDTIAQMIHAEREERCRS